MEDTESKLREELAWETHKKRLTKTAEMLDGAGASSPTLVPSHE